MSELVYPRESLKETYENLNSSFSEEKFVRINPKNFDAREYHSVLMSISREYQKFNTDHDRENFSKSFKVQIKNFILSNSKQTEQEIYNRFLEAYGNSKLQDKYKLSTKDNEKTIFNLTIVKKPDPDERYLKLDSVYPLFTEETTKMFSENSNLFSLLDINFLKEMIDQRYTIEDYKEKIEMMENESDLTDEEELRLEKIKEIYEFNIDFDNNLEPSNLLKIIEDETKSTKKLYVKFLSSILKFNIFICRAWSKEITVIKKIKIDNSLPTIILFKTGNIFSLTGKKEEEIFETGGVKLRNGIRTVLNPKFDNKIIKDLNNIYYNEADSFFMDKYLTHLDRMEQSLDLSSFEFPEEEEVKEEEEEVKEEEEEAKEEEEEAKEEESNSIFLDETKQESDPLLEEIMNVDENTYVPEFIISYTRSELIDLVKIYSDTNIRDLENISKKKLEIFYKLIFESKMNESVSSIVGEIRSEFV